MSQETSSTATSSNLEHQLADAMTAIQMLMQNVGALTQQVTTLTNSMGIMQAVQDAQSIPIFQPASYPMSPHNQPLPPSPQSQPFSQRSLLALAQLLLSIYQWTSVGIHHRRCQDLLDLILYAIRLSKGLVRLCDIAYVSRQALIQEHGSITQGD